MGIFQIVKKHVIIFYFCLKLLGFSLVDTITTPSSTRKCVVWEVVSAIFDMSNCSDNDQFQTKQLVESKNRETF